MSAESFRVIIVILLVVFGIAFLVATADLMGRHPAVPWFFFGIVAIVGVEVIGYLVYLLVKRLRE